MRKFSGLARLGLGTSVQIVASTGSIILTVAAARRFEPQEFGRFALASAMVVVCVGLVRAFSAEPLVYGERVHAAMPCSRRLSSAASGAAIVSVALGLVVVAVVGVMTNDPLIAALIGAVAVAASMQDYGRVVLVAIRRARTALLIESFSIGVLIVALFASADSRGIAWIYLCWLISSVLSALLPIYLLKLSLRTRHGVAWLRSSSRSGMAYALDFGVTTGLAQVSLLIATLVSGVSAAGAIRGAQVLLMPVSLMTRGLFTALVPEVVALAARQLRQRVRQLTYGFAAVSAVAAAITTLVAVLLPDAWLTLLLGQSTHASRTVLPWSALASATLALAMAPGLIMRTHGAVGKVAISKLVVAPVAVVFMVIGSATFAASGTQAALALGNLLRWFVTRLQLRRMESDQ